MGENIKKLLTDTIERGIDFFFNHLLTFTTFLALYGAVGHMFYPQHRDAIDASIASMLAAKRG